MTIAFTNATENTSGNLSQCELTSVTAVIAYLAYTHDISEATIRSVLTRAFDVDDVKAISSDSYDDAIRFLVDFNFGDTPRLGDRHG